MEFVGAPGGGIRFDGGPDDYKLENPTLQRSDELHEVIEGKAVLELGARGDAVRRLHAALGMHAGDEVEQGLFGRETQKAVIEIQRDWGWGLERTGKVDAETLDRIDWEAKREELPLGGDKHLRAWRAVDGETVGKEVIQDGEPVTVVDHAASAKANLHAAWFDFWHALPFAGMRYAAAEGQREVLPAGETQRTVSGQLMGIPGVGLLFAVKDLGEAAVHGLTLLFGEDHTEVTNP
jgi:hypothetical protein